MTRVPAPAKIYRCAALLTGDNVWTTPAYVQTDAQGTISVVTSTPPAGHAGPIDELRGAVIPGFVDAHSHAFQYAMTGLAEVVSPGGAEADFWTWRDAMYRLAARLSPPTLEAVAAQLYAELLRHGVTSVVEFHYLHHAPDGRAYANLAEMGERLIAAATRTGIQLTLVPILYRMGGFDTPAHAGQARFLSASLAHYAQLQAATQRAASNALDVVVGTGVHSLRAVAADEVRALLGGPFAGPAHLHVAEQPLEVEDCLKHLGCRPVAWLLDNLPLDARFNLVHATHVDDAELRRLAASDATVVLCPSTEGNLGDGFFPLREYAALGGRWAIGSDSQVSLCPLEELRWLDYGQRLRYGRRNVVSTISGADHGAAQIAAAWTRGRRAAGSVTTTAFAPFAAGQSFDAVVLDLDHPTLAGKPQARWLSALVYAGDASVFRAVLRRGVRVVEDGRHRDEPAVRRAFAAAQAELQA